MLRRNVRSRLQENGYVSERKRIDDTRRVVAFIGISKKPTKAHFDPLAMHVELFQRVFLGSLGEYFKNKIAAEIHKNQVSSA